MMFQAQQHSFGYRNFHISKSQPLGHGSYGAVYKANCDQLTCAAKVLHPTILDPQDPGAGKIMERFHQECRFLESIRHPNIVQYLDMTRDPESKLPVLLMELLDESLTKMLDRSQQPLALNIQVDICHDIALAVAYLHFNDIIHRDLSSNNVLIIAGRRAKVTDFGMSKLAGAAPTVTSLTMCPGTLAYMPPEALNEPPMYTKKLDCFSEGVIMIQVCTRLWPEPGPCTKQKQDPSSPTGEVKVPVLELERRKDHIEMINPTHALLPIAKDCLSYQESKRPSSEELCQRLASLKESSRYKESIKAQGDMNHATNNHVSLQAQQFPEENGKLLEDKDRVLLEKESEIRERDELLQRKDNQLQEERNQVTMLYQQLEAQEQITEEIQQTNNSLQRQVEQLQEQLRQQSQRYPVPQSLPPPVLSTPPPQAPMQSHPLSLVRPPPSMPSQRLSPMSQISPPIPFQTLPHVLPPSMVSQPPPLGPMPSQPLPPPFPHEAQVGGILWNSRVGRKAPFGIRRGAAVVNEDVAYFLHYSGQLCSYNSTNMRWKQLNNYHYSGGTLAVINDHLTAIGGCKDAQKKDTYTNRLLILLTWRRTEFPPMPTRRSEASAVTTSKYVIVAGGTSGKLLADNVAAVEVMDTQSLVWSSVASLPHPYCNASATICRDKLYMLGGYDDKARQNLC